MMWVVEDQKLCRTFDFASFKDAMRFMQEASIAIADLDHHPEWSNVYSQVRVQLCTHSKDNSITEKDHKLAKILDSIYCHFHLE